MATISVILMTLRDVYTAACTLSLKILCGAEENKNTIKKIRSENTQFTDAFRLSQVLPVTHPQATVPSHWTLILESTSELWKAGADFHMLMASESFFPCKSVVV